MMLKMPVRRPNPAIISAVQPAMPITVIKKRFLYRNRFRQDTLAENRKCFQINGICSSRIRLPALGALGRISAAGVSRAVANIAHRVAPTVQAKPAPIAPRLRGQYCSRCRLGKVYIIP